MINTALCIKSYHIVCLSLDDDVPPATVTGSTSASDSLPSAGKCIELSILFKMQRKYSICCIRMNVWSFCEGVNRDIHL